jgi:putative ABC transport system ATP-binding protein
LCRIDRPAHAARVLDLLDAVGIADQRDKLPEQLSGGQKQWVAIARALVTQPALVLADEPTANLDYATATMIIALMKTMQQELNTTFLFSTHDTRIIGAVEIIYTLKDGPLLGSERGKAS